MGKVGAWLAGGGVGKEMFTMALRISGVLGVWQEVVAGGGLSPQLRGMPRKELILGGRGQ